ncbi:hypothetical protein PVAP13_9KG446600 [Panicum virgatum]|uniref:Uncharacterized protein n=1 Tax=Panicum virgatum TaxID=38727 RepID=A0A8T0NXJ4_PANVG|nr:hypothetical protein PVAP13_9KG446600 [Panicum virgatum]
MEPSYKIFAVAFLLLLPLVIDVAPVIVVEAQVDCDSWCGQWCWGNGFPGGDCQGLSDLNACVCHACCYSQALGP